jgi:dynein heavy chain 1
LEEILSSAYSLVEHVDVLDVSKEGTEAWEEILKAYNENINSLESKITGELREQLATAKSADEMFRIFPRFNALFDRPQRTRGVAYRPKLIRPICLKFCTGTP